MKQQKGKNKMCENEKSVEYRYQKVGCLYYIYFVDGWAGHHMAEAHTEADAKKIVDALNMTLNK